MDGSIFSTETFIFDIVINKVTLATVNFGTVATWWRTQVLWPDLCLGKVSTWSKHVNDQSPELSLFSWAYTAYAGREIVKSHRTFIKCHWNFWEEVSKSTFSKYTSGRDGGMEGVTQKSTLCTLLIMLTILDDSWTSTNHSLGTCFTTPSFA